MCYSVMVETDLRRLQREYGAAADLDGLLELVERSLGGDSTFRIVRGLRASLLEMPGAAARRCAEGLAEIDRREAERHQEKARIQQEKIDQLQVQLRARPTKTAQEKLETAGRVRARALAAAERLTRPLRVTDDVIHQYTYAPLLIREGQQRVVRFFRYQVRPRWARQEPDRRINMFNARIDSLEERRTWAQLFMKRHGVLVYRGFYEWVPGPVGGKPAIINFFPEDRRLLWSPALHETWEPEGAGGTGRIDSFAILTTEPLPEVLAMGHDRCPVFPRSAGMDDWLNPASSTQAHIMRLLADQEPVHFAWAWGVTAKPFASASGDGEAPDGAEDEPDAG